MEKLYEAFRQMMDDIYYPGYLQVMEISDPIKINFEWEQFLKMFSR